MSEHINTYTKWTQQEWEAVAKRAAAFKEAHPHMSWTRIVPICQDDVAPERRRRTVNTLPNIKPVFDILGLNEFGEPVEPEPVDSKKLDRRLMYYSTEAIVAELVTRLQALNTDVDSSSITEQINALARRVSVLEQEIAESATKNS